MFRGFFSLGDRVVCMRVPAHREWVDESVFWKSFAVSIWVVMGLGWLVMVVWLLSVTVFA